MSEIRAWVHASNDGVRPPDEHRPSARELRRFRRQIKKRLEDSGQHHAPAAGTKDGYFFVDIVGRCVSPSGHLSYLVQYAVGSNKTPVLLWEQARQLPHAALSTYEARTGGFSYTEEEKELMKKCQGSLKERTEQERVKTTAGIFAVRHPPLSLLLPLHVRLSDILPSPPSLPPSLTYSRSHALTSIFGSLFSAHNELWYYLVHLSPLRSRVALAGLSPPRGILLVSRQSAAEVYGVRCAVIHLSARVCNFPLTPPTQTFPRAGWLPLKELC